MLVFGNDDLTEFGVNSWLTYKGVESFGMTGQVFNTKQETTLDLLANFEDFRLNHLPLLGKM